ncbi:AraC family transcriptional regulator [Burkholderia stagnalis]|uniref:AraC family transcriptional regulator n=1 Tax=Burkholderia stagnalis TaxID=1503054 RepID=A0A6L3N2G8_9BURK|nr:AraC family transcriptional regulator [Burkholderia stagnalis]KAB0640126.1 AraC family transcriptional regulator [Burkholderia stagnalis]KVO39964.1 AraC family transcriptional regulator [Burkholderia stagnalis]KVO64481.1 AraC family transcriptional regulator [Burkholderia stagnalis]KVW54375.1 AraC family transcriptional regulator [Burkholderia stagnalis]KVW78133.1 AraC family transcriptional regulator [Burkholderia stagnalis]
MLVISGQKHMTSPLAKDRLGLRRPTIPVAYPRLLLQVLGARVVDLAAVRAGTGLRDAVLAEPDARVAPSQWGRLVLNAIEIGGDEGIGLAFGLQLKPTMHGFLGYATLTARDIRESLQVTIRYFRMRNRQYRLTYAEDENGATLELHGVQASPVLQHHVMFEFVLTGLAQNIAQLSGRAAPDIALRFAWPEPAYFAGYRAQLPPVRFGCAANALWIARDVLDWPLPLADEVAHRQALVQVEREYAQVRQEEGDLVERVRAELARAAGGYPGPEMLAQQLLVSTRTLRRRLEEAGASYRQLLDEARYRDAKQLLAASDLDLKTIAERLQFTDPANFTRAFRRWAGQTPSAYREAAAA